MPPRVSGRYTDLSDGSTVIEKYANGVATASGDNVCVAAVTGKKLRVLRAIFQSQETAAQCVARFQDNGTATNRSMPFWLTASADGTSQQAFVLPGDGAGLFETGEGVGLDLNLSSATDIGWHIVYVEVE